MSNNYYVKERMFAFGAKFDVYDKNGKEIFYAEADKFDIGKNISIYKSDGGRKVLYMEQQIRIGAHKYEVFDLDGIHVATIKKEFMTPVYNISGKYGNIIMESNSIFGRNYNVFKEGVIIGAIEKEWNIFGKDRYSLIVKDKDYTIFLVGLLIMIDMIRFHED
ncbi:LURP-one-related/scramblase family protein [Clostridium tarantellae]|uniref:LURP-one-related family protein n=1 Tax=Clostridium tarantellae TaxID=39493 RepID=A0A6I1MQ15_9CLOT|nr:LURP-one-related family protein [Clostridium tarantellae]MPQ44322.1 hypothetical protein [Clostridium tarantellae]